MITSCPCCGLAQRLPEITPGQEARCARCATALPGGLDRGSAGRTAALALAALILYPLAMTLPVMTIERFGHRHEAGIVEGAITLLARGHVLVALIVLTCSLVVPLLKLLALLFLSAAGRSLQHEHRALTYRLIEWTGRWGMLDVLLVALLVAFLKLGDLVQVRPGSGAVAFATLVLLSLLAAASFDRRCLWDTAP